MNGNISNPMTTILALSVIHVGMHNAYITILRKNGAEIVCSYSIKCTRVLLIKNEKTIIFYK